MSYRQEIVRGDTFYWRALYNRALWRYGRVSMFLSTGASAHTWTTVQAFA